MDGLADELERLELEEQEQDEYHDTHEDIYFENNKRIPPQTWEIMTPAYTSLFFSEDKELEGDKVILPPNVLAELSKNVQKMCFLDYLLIFFVF